MRGFETRLRWAEAHVQRQRGHDVVVVALRRFYETLDAHQEGSAPRADLDQAYVALVQVTRPDVPLDRLMLKLAEWRLEYAAEGPHDEPPGRPRASRWDR